MLRILCGLLTVTFTSLYADSISGQWVGTMKSGGSNTPVRARFERDTGFLTLPLERIFDRQLTELKVSENQVLFTLTSDAGSLKFSGTIEKDLIQGEFSKGSSRGAFELIHVVSISPEKYFGVYQMGLNDFVYIRTWDELGEQQLTYLDDSGNVGPLFAKSEKEFFSGPGLMIPLPATTQMSFEKNEITWVKNGVTKKGKRVHLFQEEEVVFANGPIQLSGTLLTPEDKGPHPAVIFVHGSGPVTRDFLGPVPYILARQGIAVLTYDKRGIGKSKGHWLEADFQTLASDALAAFEFVKQRKNMDSSRIGLFGISQGGWILPVAASKSSQIGFLVLASAAAVTPAQQQIMVVTEQMRIGGLSQEKIDAAVAETKSQFDQLRSEEARSELEAQVSKLSSEGKDGALKMNGQDNPKFLLFYREILDFDPVPFLQKIQCPVLAIYGELDSLVPVQSNRKKLEEALRAGGNQKVTVRVIPKADHAFLLSKTGSLEEFPSQNQFAPDFLKTLVAWIKGL